MHDYISQIPNVELEQNTITLSQAEMQADLVIDARGRNAVLFPNEAENKQAYRVTTVGNDLSYATQFYSLSDTHSAPFKQIYIPAYAGISDYGCVISPIEDSKVIVTLIGRGSAARPQKNQVSFSRHLEKINNEQVMRYLQQATPISDIKLFTDLNNEHRHVSQIKNKPAKCVVIGDAVCKINPIYGQGMLLAAKQVATLESSLAKQSKFNTHRIQKKIDRILLLPWLMATTEDKRGQPRKTTSLRCTHYCIDKLFQLCVRYEKMHLAFLRFLHGI